VQQFIVGFIFGLVIIVPMALFLCRGRSQNGVKKQDDGFKQLEELSRLTGGLAHEIKNPLSTVKVNLKLAQEELKELKSVEQDDRRLKSALRKISVVAKETSRLEKILEDFLRYISTGRLQLVRTDINELVRDMIDFYRPQCRTSSIAIREGLSSEPVICEVDANMLKQVLLNLFINANQAIDGAGELMIKTNRVGENAVIAVGDTGSGMPQEKLSRIFDAFYSLRPKGTGLGLPTAKKIIEAHKGTITVDSEPGKGTLFTITLPVCVS